MIRVVALLVLVALATQIAMLADTNAGTAILFSFVGTPVLGLGMVLVVFAVRSEARARDRESDPLTPPP